MVLHEPYNDLLIARHYHRIRYIKDLLGHLSIKTTKRYLHLKREQLINIPNLLNELNKAVDLE